MWPFAAMTHLAESRLHQRRIDMTIERRYNGLSRDTLSEVVSKANDTFDLFAVADWEARQLLAQPGLAQIYTIVMKLPSQIHVGLSANGEFGELAYARNTTAEGGMHRIRQKLPNTVGGRASATGLGVEVVVSSAGNAGLTLVTWEPVASLLQASRGLLAATLSFPHDAYLFVHARRMNELRPLLSQLLPELRTSWNHLMVRPELGVRFLLHDDRFVTAVTDQFRALATHGC